VNDKAERHLMTLSHRAHIQLFLSIDRSVPASVAGAFASWRHSAASGANGRMGDRRCEAARASDALSSLGMSASHDFIFRNQFPKLIRAKASEHRRPVWHRFA
jgi:hypothetical protein